MQIITKKNKAILLEMVRTDFKLRYQNSVLGYLWSLLRPLLLSVILYEVFVNFLHVSGDIRHFASYLLLGIMCWTFFAEVTTGSVGAVVGKGDLIRKISIPRYLVVVSASTSALINFVLNFIVLTVIMAINGVEVQTKLFVLIPLLLIELYALSLAVAFILSAAYVKFRDVSFIWEVFMQMMFYLTPIIYPISKVLDKYPHIGKLILLNPVAQILQDLRYIVITPQSQTVFGLLSWWALVPVAIVLFLVTFSVWYFRREARSFAENV